MSEATSRTDRAREECACASSGVELPSRGVLGQVKGSARTEVGAVSLGLACFLGCQLFLVPCESLVSARGFGS